MFKVPTVALISNQMTSFEKLCNGIGVKCKRFDFNVDPSILNEYDGIIICTPSYPYHELDNGWFLEVLQLGKGVYYEYIPPVGLKSDLPTKAVLERGFISDTNHFITSGLDYQQILDIRQGHFTTIEKDDWKEIISIGKVPGTHIIYDKPIGDTSPMLIVSPDNKIIYSAFPISRCSVNNLKPSFVWNQVVEKIIISVLPEEVRRAYEEAYFTFDVKTSPRIWAVPETNIDITVDSSMEGIPEIKIDSHFTTIMHTRALSLSINLDKGSYIITASAENNFFKRTVSTTLDIMDRDTAYRIAVNSNIGWFRKSGIMLSADGKNGVLEKIAGNTDSNDIPMLHQIKRTDCNLQTALVFRLYSELTGDEKYNQIAENIIQSLFDINYQDIDPESLSYGFWRWGYYDTHNKFPHYLWTDDNSWAIMILGLMYLKTDNSEYLRRAMLTMEAFKSTQNQITGLRPAVIHRPEIEEKGKEWMRTQEGNRRFSGNYNPHWDGLGLAAYLMMHMITGEGCYLEIAEKGLDTLLNTYPDIEPNEKTISRTSEEAKILLPLSLAYYLTRKQKYYDYLIKHADYIFSHQNKCGAIEEADNPRVDGYGMGDIGVFHLNGECITDQLYTTGFAMMDLFISYKATGDMRFLDGFHKLGDYAVAIQIRNQGPRFDGSWMRAFDFKNWEYYGSNGDVDWGPYCIETGWCNTLINIALSMYLQDTVDFLIKKQPVDLGDSSTKVLNHVSSKILS